jgi:hypothetical protein
MHAAAGTFALRHKLTTTRTTAALIVGVEAVTAGRSIQPPTIAAFVDLPNRSWS